MSKPTTPIQPEGATVPGTTQPAPKAPATSGNPEAERWAEMTRRDDARRAGKKP